MFALGFGNYWDTYFGRAAPLGLATAEVVDASLEPLASLLVAAQD